MFVSPSASKSAVTGICFGVLKPNGMQISVLQPSNWKLLSASRKNWLLKNVPTWSWQSANQSTAIGRPRKLVEIVSPESSELLPSKSMNQVVPLNTPTHLFRKSNSLVGHSLSELSGSSQCPAIGRPPNAN